MRCVACVRVGSGSEAIWSGEVESMGGLRLVKEVRRRVRGSIGVESVVAMMREGC